ncbi:MAG: IPT/TIG domain-containing protein [Acidimicrobiales bacterium]
MDYNGNVLTGYYVPPPPTPAPTVTSITPTSGPTSGGTSVTITGDNLWGAGYVFFGKTSVPFSVYETASGVAAITATSPAGTGTVNVTVTTPGGTSATSSADQFTYEAPPPPTPAPTITSITPASGPTSGGTAVTITGTNFDTTSGGTGTTVDFGSTPATSVVCSSTTSCTATSPAGTGTVNVTVTTPGGTSATSSADQFTYEAPPPPTPAPTVASISPASGPTSGGTVVTITGTNFDTTSGGAEVDFGSTPATSVVCSSTTSCTATSPVVTSPGLVNVTVTTPGGTTAPIGFLYVTSSLGYVGVIPYRIADTRCSANPQPSFCTLENLPSANNTLTSPAGGTSITVQVTGTGTGSDAVPSTAQSVVLNVTAIASSTAKGGYLTVYPTATLPPTASSLNYIPGAAIPNLVTATLGKGGAVSIFSSSANVNIVVDVEGYYAPSNPSNNMAMFNPLSLPIRALDTRCTTSAQPSYCAAENIPSVNSSIPAPARDAGVAVTVAGVGGSSGVPSTGATAVSLVVTAAGPSSGGYLSVWPDAGSCTIPPMTSDVNFYADTSASNSVVVASGTGKVCVYNSAATAINVVMDINGYFSLTGDTLTASSPVRICDTRSLLALGGAGDVASGVSGQCANGGVSLNPSASSSDPITLQVTGIGGIPATAKAVVANVTVVDTTGNGYLQVFPAGATRPSTSNINWAKGQVIPNMVTSALSSSGQIDIYASNGTDVIVDVVGWYS